MRADVGVRIAALDDMTGANEASALLSSIWSKEPGEPIIAPSTLRALAESGNYVQGAYAGERMIGAVVGFLGTYEGRTQLHSHILGVDPSSQSRNVGYQLKQHQRTWCLERGIDLVTWTFDPLVRRNAFFNLTKLGADIAAYHENFYGRMADGINASDETDRALVVWELRSPSAVRAAEGRFEEPSLEGGEVILDDGPAPRTARATLLLAKVPEDIVAMRSSDPDLARGWRFALREALGGALAEGYRTAGMTRSGWYVLRRS